MKKINKQYDLTCYLCFTFDCLNNPKTTPSLGRAQQDPTVLTSQIKSGGDLREPSHLKQLR